MIRSFCLFIFFAGYTFASSNIIDNVSSNINNTVFEENKGQLIDKVLFSANLPGGRIFFERDAFTYVFYDVKQWDEQEECRHQPGCVSELVNAHAYQMKLLNSNPDVNILHGNSSTTYRNYFVGNDRTEWASRVKLYDEFTYQNIYNHIDLKVYKESGNLPAGQAGFKYDFIIQPGGNPNDIILEYEGIEHLTSEKKDVKLTTSVNEVIENMPSVYQIKTGKKDEVNCEYLIEGNKVKFKVLGKYDPKYPLVIDPEVVISSYIGNGEGIGATYGENGTMYVCTANSAIGYPTTVGAFQMSINGTFDMAISKFDSTGSNVLYATYVGGSIGERAIAMRIDANNNLCVIGTSNSLDFPITTNAYDTSFNGGDNDLVMFKLGPNGDTLLASTYLGGSNIDGVDNDNTNYYAPFGSYFGELIPDIKGNWYVSSSTSSNDFPTKNALQGTYGGGPSDGILLKIGADLDTVYWSTFLGGSEGDAAFHVNIGPDSLLYIAGATRSNLDFPHIPVNGYQTINAGGGDAYILKMMRDDGTIVGGTLLGTNGSEAAFFIDFDIDSNVYVLGTANLGNYPVSECRYFQQGAGMFIHKLNNSLTSSFYSTRIGAGDAQPLSFMIDSCSRIYTLCWGGITPGNGLPITKDAFDSVTSAFAVSQYYIAILSANARSLDYATYLGGGHNGDLYFLNEHSDGGLSRFNKQDMTLYAGGCTYSPDFPTDINDAYPIPFGPFEPFGVKMIMNNLVNRWEPEFDYSGPTKGCKPVNADFLASIPCGYESTWYFGVNNDSLVENFPSYLYDTAGTFNIMIVSVDTLIGDLCKLPPDTGYLSIEVVDELIISVVGDSSICFGDSLLLTALNADSFAWSPSVGLQFTDSSVTQAFPSSTTTYEVIGFIVGCSDTVEHTVNVFPLPSGACCDDTIFLGQSTVLTASSGNTYIWSPALGLSCTDCANPSASPDSTTTYYVTITTPDGCQKVDTIIVYVLEELLSVPSIFSPNGDGTNDYFEIFHKGIKEVLEYKIFNRWGEIIFESDDLNEQWDGTYRDQIQEIGVYYYKIHAVSEKGTDYIQDGVVSLIR